AHGTTEPTENQCDWTATPSSPVAGSRATIEYVNVRHSTPEDRVPLAAVTTDFEAEGLLDGLEDRALEARRRLLEELETAGVPLDELRQAVAESRLALLPLERELTPAGPRYTFAEVAEKSGLDPDFLATL